MNYTKKHTIKSLWQQLGSLESQIRIVRKAHGYGCDQARKLCREHTRCIHALQAKYPNDGNRRDCPHFDMGR